VAAKTRASLMVEGELPEEGLAALDGDGGDIYLALARRLAEPARSDRLHKQSLEALFAEARRGEDQAEELLDPGCWEDEVPTTREAVVLPARHLPLVAAIPPPAEATSAPPTGRVVSLEELAQLLQPRRRRSKPAPDGQLALFRNSQGPEV
jgi:hypothetical protein